MDYWRREQIGAATGIIAVALMGIGTLIAGTYPAPGSTDATIVTFLTDRRDELRAQAFLFGAASACVLWFLGSLRGFLRRAEGGSGRLSVVTLAGGIVAVIGSALAMLFVIGAAARPADGIGLFTLARYATWMTAFPVAVIAGSTTLVAVRTRCLPQMVVLLGAIATGFAGLSTLAVFYDTGALAPGGSLAFFGVFAAASAWIAATSAVLIPKLQQPSDVSLARRRITDLGWRAEPLPERRNDARRLEDRVAQQRRRVEDAAADD